MKSVEIRAKTIIAASILIGSHLTGGCSALNPQSGIYKSNKDYSQVQPDGLSCEIKKGSLVHVTIVGDRRDIIGISGGECLPTYLSFDFLYGLELVKPDSGE